MYFVQLGANCGLNVPRCTLGGDPIFEYRASERLPERYNVAHFAVNESEVANGMVSIGEYTAAMALAREGLAPRIYAQGVPLFAGGGDAGFGDELQRCPSGRAPSLAAFEEPPPPRGRPTLSMCPMPNRIGCPIAPGHWTLGIKQRSLWPHSLSDAPEGKLDAAP